VRVGGKLAAPDHVVDEKAEPQQRRRPRTRIDRQHEAQRPDQMRRQAQQHLALAERRADEPQRAVFQIPQAAVNELGGCGRSAGGEIALFEKHDLQSPTGRIARNARAIDAAANNRQIEVGHRPAIFAALERDGFMLTRHRALVLCWSMIFSENRQPLFRIMLCPSCKGR
jgi:hypothetical protein